MKRMYDEKEIIEKIKKIVEENKPTPKLIYSAEWNTTSSKWVWNTEAFNFKKNKIYLVSIFLTENQSNLQATLFFNNDNAQAVTQEINTSYVVDNHDKIHIRVNFNKSWEDSVSVYSPSNLFTTNDKVEIYEL